jgi:hypothetical protein
MLTPIYMFAGIFLAIVVYLNVKKFRPINTFEGLDQNVPDPEKPIKLPVTFTVNGLNFSVTFLPDKAKPNMAHNQIQFDGDPNMYDIFVFPEKGSIQYKFSKSLFRKFVPPLQCPDYSCPDYSCDNCPQTCENCPEPAPHIPKVCSARSMFIDGKKYDSIGTTNNYIAV